MEKQLKNKTALITGGGSGIGKSIAQKFVKEGASVMIMGRTENKLKNVINNVLGSKNATYFVGDVSNACDTDKSAEYMIKEYGKVDIIVQNAGISPTNNIIPFKDFESTTFEEWKEVIDINLTGSFNIMKSYLPFLKNNEKNKKIIFISSIAGPRSGVPGLSHYSASKAALNGFMRSLSVELAKYHINCNSVLPGNILAEEEGRPKHEVNQEVMAIPAGRVGLPSDVANLVLFLASDESNFITGQEFVVDGGQTILPDFRLIQRN